MPYDLFGEIPVTEDELVAWVAAVSPRWLSSDNAYRYYVRNWNVAGKIRYAKLCGTFEDVINRQARTWHARLSLDVII